MSVRALDRFLLRSMVLCSAVFTATQASAVTRFVDLNSPGPIHNGTSWTSAYTSLQTALGAANSGDEVWIANGTYKPTNGTDRTIAFVVPNGVKLFGGFAGFGVGENSLSQRDILGNRTILSGDIGAAGIADNSFTVVNLSNVLGTTHVDGVFITAGHANGGGGNNQGAGIRTNGSPVIRNCVLVGNVALTSGGAVLCSGATAFVHCVFSGNAASTGAAIDMQSSHINVINCTVAKNINTDSEGAAIRLLNGDSINIVRNSIIYDNSAPGPAPQDQQILADNAVLQVDRSCIEGLDGSLGGSGNTGAVPRFVDTNGPDNVHGTVDDNYALRGGSAGIDAGSNSFISSDSDDLDDDGITAETLPFDISYQPRKTEDIVNNTGAGTTPIVDMGAYEFMQPVRVICVNDTATGANNGSSWENAYTTLQNALFDAGDVKEPLPEEIWVAQGTYKPEIPVGRGATFNLLGGVPIYGGFDDTGTQGSLSQRNPHSHRAILSGDIGLGGTAIDNSFHVVTSNGGQFFADAVLDGFVITGGNANGTGADTNGGGLRAFGQSDSGPIVRNGLFVGNQSTIGGAAVDSLNSDLSLINCVISGNSVVTSNVRAVRFGNVSAPRMTNCTVANNNSGGVTVVSSASLTIDNSIFAGNSGSSQADQLLNGTGTVVLNHSCIQGLNGSFGGAGNISVLPSFLDPNGADNIFGTPDDDYHILACSSVIDAGNFNALPVDAEDLDDDGIVTERLQQDVSYAARFENDPGVPNTGLGVEPPDMGAFEYQDRSGPTCPADCFPVGAPNSVVNIDDLVTVITQWGGCLSGNCAGDVFPPCKNQVIDIDDLVSVITAWGNCP